MFFRGTDDRVTRSRTQSLGHLLELRTQSPNPSVDQQRFAFGEARDRRQGEVRGHSVDGHHRREVMIQLLRDGGDQCCWGAHNLGEAPGSWKDCGDQLPFGEVIHALTKSTDSARNLQAGNKVRVRGHGPNSPEGINKPQSSGMNRDAYLPRFRCRFWFLHILQATIIHCVGVHISSYISRLT